MEKIGTGGDYIPFRHRRDATAKTLEACQRHRSIFYPGRHLVSKGTRFFQHLQKAEFERQGSTLVGLQWRLSESVDPTGGVWFYHGVERERIRRILADDGFPECQPFSTRSLLNSSVSLKAVDVIAQPDEDADSLRRQIAENMLPDGSFFGIGFGKIDGLLEVDAQQTDLDKLKLATLS